MNLSKTHIFLFDNISQKKVFAFAREYVIYKKLNNPMPNQELKPEPS